jgi:lipopolysaccharide/colanic/teichoic acid biosynthesis glycosyltransferase
MTDTRAPLPPEKRLEMVAALEKRFSRKKTCGQRVVFLRKKYGWLIVVKGAHFVKRMLDVIISLLLLILLLPLFLVIAITIKIEDSGPVLYVARRVGKWGKEFNFPKFRTMAVGSDRKRKELMDKNIRKEAKAFKGIDDPRVTRFGKFLRKTSMDELPQLWTVLKGDMSLVGPRPPLPDEVALYTLEERRRLDAVPGITGLWQVSGRADVPFEKQMGLDLEYLESRSLWLDIKILLKTIPAVFSGRGAY